MAFGDAETFPGQRASAGSEGRHERGPWAKGTGVDGNRTDRIWWRGGRRNGASQGLSPIGVVGIRAGGVRHLNYRIGTWPTSF